MSGQHRLHVAFFTRMCSDPVQDVVQLHHCGLLLLLQKLQDLIAVAYPFLLQCMSSQQGFIASEMPQMAAAFALGASGVVLGTVLNATHESVYPEAKKQALVKAGSASSSNPSTIRTTLYDELSGLPWPLTIDGQCLRNSLTAEYSSQTPLQVRHSFFMKHRALHFFLL